MDVDVVVDAAPIVAEVEDPNKLRHSMIGERETLKETSSAKEYSRKSSVCTKALAYKRKGNIMIHVQRESNYWNKLRRITRPGVAIRQKLADSEIICVSTYDKSEVIIPLDPNSNTVGI